MKKLLISAVLMMVAVPVFATQVLLVGGVVLTGTGFGSNIVIPYNAIHTNDTTCEAAKAAILAEIPARSSSDQSGDFTAPFNPVGQVAKTVMLSCVPK